MTIDHEDLNLDALEATARAAILIEMGRQEYALSTRLREAEAVIEGVRDLVTPPKPFTLGKSMMRSFDQMIGDLRAILATYKTTNHEIRRQDHA